MFTIDKKEYRNLQEQVLKNKEDIAAHYAIDRVLAEFGIRVIGVAASYDDLDQNYQGEYGDAFAVGTEPPYIFYIWTRPDPAAGHDTAYWFSVGELAIVGPQGIPGTSVTDASLNADNQLVFTFSDGRIITIPRSLKGEPGGSPSITLTSTDEGVTIKVFSAEGTLEQSALVRNGEKGQSIQGPPGPAGSAIIFKGIITSISQLDGVVPETPNDAYLLDDGTNKYIIGLVNYNWTNLGLLTGGTAVTVDGIIQNEWNADTKVNKITNEMSNISSSYEYIYVSNKNRNLSPRRMDDRVMSTVGEAAYQIVCRDRSGNGQINVPNTPTATTHAASKSYVDSKAYNRTMKSCIATFSTEAYISYYMFGDREQMVGGYERTPTYMWMACNGVLYNTGYPIYAFQYLDYVSEDDSYETIVRYFNTDDKIVEEMTIYGQPTIFEGNFIS